VLDAADARPSDRVVDLGAGTGALTLPVAEAAASVLTVELDPQWVERLRAAAAPFPNIQVVHADLRDVPLPASPFRVIASPPYHLSTELVRRLLTLDLPLRDATLVLEQSTRRRNRHPTPGRPRVRASDRAYQPRSVCARHYATAIASISTRKSGCARDATTATGMAGGGWPLGQRSWKTEKPSSSG
jgi:23S rRNA (adenine-N6)-dimethyltransferase